MKLFTADDLRRSISPKPSDALAAWILPLIMIAAFGIATGIVIFHAGQAGDWAKVFKFGGAYLGVVVISILAGVLGMRQIRIEAVIKEQRLAALSEEALILLADEIAQEELRYGAFYFLDNYVYFPAVGALIHYHDIAKWRTIQDHFFGFTDHVWVEVTEADGFVHRYSIREKRSYLKDVHRVAEELEQRKWGAS